MNDKKDGLQKSETAVVRPLTKLTTFKALCKDLDTAFDNDKMNMLLNQLPPANWVIEHPIIKKEIIDPLRPGEKIKVPIQYLPIEKVEYMLTKIFQEWRVEVLDIKALFNSLCVTVRVHYLNPMTGLWSYHDGVGAVGVQLDKDTKDWDLSKIKTDAVMKGLPAAKSYALKDACDHFGKLFGRDLNRTNTIPFVPGYATEEDPDYTQKLELTDQVKTEIELADTPEEVNRIWNSNKQFQSNAEFIQLIMKRKEKISA